MALIGEALLVLALAWPVGVLLHFGWAFAGAIIEDKGR
jgi:hypothetical protein